MRYSPEEVSRDLTLVGEGSASFEVRARLENHLLSLLREQGHEALATFLCSLPGHTFRSVGESGSAPEARFVSAGSGPVCIVVTAYLGPHSASVNVVAEEESTEPLAPDPRHQAFYAIWEKLLGIQDSAVAKLEPERNAVFLVALLEAEVMNGGLGQYLANTDGVYIEDTVECLAKIGAEKTRAILIKAGELGAKAESFTAAWESYARDFERLDEHFLESGEDLAGLTVAVFIDRS